MKSKIKKLHSRSNLKGFFSIIIEWILIFTTIVISEYFDLIWLTITSIFFIAGRQHALAFCVHEGVHYSVLKNKKMNDLFVNIFAAWPLFIEIQTYRGNHLAHHRFNNTEKDPDWVRKNNKEWIFPRSSKKILIDFLRSFFGLESIKTLYALSGLEAQKKGLTPKFSPSITMKTLRVIHFLSLITFIFKTGSIKYYFLYWALPQFTVLQVLNRIRKISEHFGVYNPDPGKRTRTVLPSLWEKFFIAPKNIGYHSEHHLYPQVPYYNLKKLHSELIKEKSNIHITKGYLNVLRECIR